MIQRIDDIYKSIEGAKTKRVAVAAAADLDVLLAVCGAQEKNIANAILFGDKEKISKILIGMKRKLEDYEIVDAPDPTDAAAKAVACVAEGNADFLMKGMLESGAFLKAVLDPKYNLRIPGRIISSMAMFDVTELGKLIFVTDPGFIPLPDLNAKRQIIENAVEALHKLGYEEPRIAVLSVAETVNPKILSSVEGRALEEMNQRGEITGCKIAGPISLDLAISERSAAHKGYNSPVAGKADVLVVPSLEVGNVLLKSMIYFAHFSSGGIVIGAKVPIVFNSRSDSAQTKQNTIATAALLSMKG